MIAMPNLPRNAIGQCDGGGLRRRGPNNTRRGTNSVTPSLAQKFGANPSSCLPAIPSCPMKGSLFHRSISPVGGMPQPGPPSVLGPFSRSPEPLCSYLHCNEQVRGAKSAIAIFCRAYFLVNFIVSGALAACKEIKLERTSERREAAGRGGLSWEGKVVGVPVGSGRARQSPARLPSGC